VKRFLKVLLAFGLLGMAAAGGAGYLLWTRMHEPFQGFQGEQFVEIPTGDGSRAIARRLADAGVVPDSWTFRAAVRWLGRGQALQAGEYRFADAASPLDVVERLARGDVYTIGITFPEGLTIDEMAAVFESRGLGTAQVFRDAARDVSAIAALDPAARDLEGYLFPSTYQLPRKAGAAGTTAASTGATAAAGSNASERSAATDLLALGQTL